MIRSELARLLRLFRHVVKRDAEREPPSHFFTPDETGRLHRITLDARTALDEQTWHDLLLPAYEEQLAQGAGIFGRQVLHRRLRAGLDDAGCAVLGERLRGLLADPARLDALNLALRPLRYAETEVAGLLSRARRRKRPPGPDSSGCCRCCWLYPWACSSRSRSAGSRPWPRWRR